MTAEIVFQPISLSEAISLLYSDLETKRPASYFFINSYSIALTEKNVSYRKILSDNDRNLIDGKPIKILLNAFRDNSKPYEQIRGVDFTREILATFPIGNSIFLLGGTEENLEALVHIFKSSYPKVNIVGTFSPSYDQEWKEYIDFVVAQIDRSGANLVMISLGTPKQDFVSREIAYKLNLVVVSVGAALDFISSQISECPRWLRVIGAEWFYRLITEPKRLWRRYLLESPKLIKLFFKKRF